MKLRDQLRFMREEIERSKKWRENERHDELWHRLIDLYKGKHYVGTTTADRLTVNLAFATKNVIAPSVAIRNPKFVVNARDPDKAPNAVVTEEVINYYWRCYRYQEEIRLAVDDWIICGHGWLKSGYKFTKEPVSKPVEDGDEMNQIDPGETEGIDDRAPVEGNVETEMIVTYDRPFLERLSIFDVYVDPDARHPKEMRWIAQRIWRPVQDVKVDERYSPTARRAVSGTSYSRLSTPDRDGRSGEDAPDAGKLQYAEVIEFYDLKRRTVATFALQGSDSIEQDNRNDGFLIKPKQTPYGFDNPFMMLRGFEIPDHFYPMGDLESIESPQLELNETRTQMINHRKRFARKWLYMMDAFTTEGLQALQSDVDNTMVPVQGDFDLNRVLAPMPSIVTPPDFYNHSAMIENDINQISGVSDYMRGQAEANIKRTATEAAMIQDAANARAQDRLDRVESFLADCGERIVKLMQQFMTGEQVVRLVGIAGRVWVPYDRDYIQGDFDFEVEAGSTEPYNESFRRQAALQMVDAMAPFVGAGVVDPSALARHILQYGFGIKNTAAFMAPPQPQQMIGPDGQPMPPEGQVPPGALGPSDMPQPGAMMPQSNGSQPGVPQMQSDQDVMSQVLQRAVPAPNGY